MKCFETLLFNIGPHPTLTTDLLSISYGNYQTLGGSLDQNHFLLTIVDIDNYTVLGHNDAIVKLVADTVRSLQAQRDKNHPANDARMTVLVFQAV